MCSFVNVEKAARYSIELKNGKTVECVYYHTLSRVLFCKALQISRRNNRWCLSCRHKVMLQIVLDMPDNV